MIYALFKNACLQSNLHRCIQFLLMFFHHSFIASHKYSLCKSTVVDSIVNEMPERPKQLKPTISRPTVHLGK